MYVNTCSQSYKFTGKERDAESSLDYSAARHYGSSPGRFITPDPLLASGLTTQPQTWNRYSYVTNNPLIYTDPTGLFGRFFDEDGRELGTDGVDDDKLYVVSADNVPRSPDGTINVSAFGPNDYVAMPSADVRSAVGDAVYASNQPNAQSGDQGGRFHEEGLKWGLDANGNQAIVPAQPGQYAPPGASQATINLDVPADPADAGRIVTPQGAAHVHPSGQATTGPSSGAGVVVFGGTTRTREFDQPPSQRDINNARPGTNIVAGARSGKVYFYDNIKPRATFPLKLFVSLR